MNRGMLSDLVPQNQNDLYRLLEYLYQNRQEPMLTGPMMLAQANTKQPGALQRIFGGPSDVMSPKDRLAYCQADPEGVGCERFRDVNKPAPATPYSLGKETPQEMALRARQEEESRKAGQKDLFYKNLRQRYPNMPESEVIKRSDEQRASGRPPIY